jgi:vacuolar-type H+-ATPase subunit I/STV1
MAKWFRSEPMEYISMILNEDAAHDCLADLGKMGILQFTDVSKAIRKDITELRANDPFLQSVYSHSSISPASLTECISCP